ncbi:glutaminase [Streptomyces sp. NPDC002602]|uniref:glutaminase n=1 Tax=Streptomyces sp. NPDC002602 TaxID=3364654 RepID=UPI0036AEB012
MPAAPVDDAPPGAAPSGPAFLGPEPSETVRFDYQGLLERIAADIAPVIGRGTPAEYIPALASVDPAQFGMAVVDLEGNAYGVGDWQVPFSTQSITKVFALALALAEGGDSLWERVGREPSGNPFNSLVQLEYENGIPRNPFINAGALVVTDRLQTLTGDASSELLQFLREESENPAIGFDAEVAASEQAHGDRNAAVAHFMASYGNIDNPVPALLEHYFWQCSIEMTCADLARAGRVLARHGLRADGTRLLTRSEAKQINAVMLTCGTYDAAGEFAYRVGLPGKSGVGGGIVAVVPGRCSIAVWSPGLDAQGNSVAGVAALDRFTTLTGLSVF